MTSLAFSSLHAFTLISFCSVYSNSLLGALNARRKMRSIFDTSSVGTSLPSFRISRSKGTTTTVKTGGVVPLEPLAFAERAEVSLGFNAEIVSREERMTCELERDAYESKKGVLMAPTTQGDS
jgi:hypothetical protein